TPGKNGPPTLGKEKICSQKQHDWPNLTPVACTAADGSVRVGFQENLDTGYVHLKGGEVIGSGGVASGGGNPWGHAIAAGPDGALTLAYGSYVDGDYDVVLEKDPIPPNHEVPVATSSKFEARPSLAYDPQGRLWVAYEEGPERWGKDYGALVPGEGEPLYSARSVRVVCFQDG